MISRNIEAEGNAKGSDVISLKGSNPVDPKSPDGEIWVEEAAVATTK
jgi:hypothetical protein